MKSKADLVFALFAMLCILAGATIPLLALGLVQWAVAVFIGFLVSFAYIIFAYMTIRHAFHDSGRLFFRCFFAGMAIRFFFFLLSLFFIYQYTRLPIEGFVLSFMLFYIILQLFEAGMVLTEIKESKVK